MKWINTLFLLNFAIISIGINAASREKHVTLNVDGGYLAQHKPEELTTDLGVFFHGLDTWPSVLDGQIIPQSEYDAQFLELLFDAIQNGLQTDEIKKLRRIFNKGAIERLLEETDLEEGLIQLIGDVEIDLIEKFREFVRKRIEMRIVQLSETAFGEKLDEWKERLDHLPPFIKDKIEDIILKLLENSTHLPESIKEKIKEYNEIQNAQSSTWETVSSIGSYALSPFTSMASYISDSIWPNKKETV